MRIHRLLVGLLSFATLSPAAWKTFHDAPDGWSGLFSLTPSDSTPRPLTAQRLAVPFGSTPTIKATLVGPDSSRSAVSFVQTRTIWNGASILQVNLELSSAQRHLANLAKRQVRLEVLWSRTVSGASLAPIVRNTIANPIGAANFGTVRAAARRSALILPALPTGPALTVEIGDLTKRDDRIVSRTSDNGIFRLTGKDLKSLFGSLAGSSLRNISVYRSARDTLPSVSGNVVAPSLNPVRIERISSNLDGQIQDNDEIRFYAEGTSVWVPDPEAPCGSKWKLSVSPYALSRRYLVALQPDGDKQRLSPEIGSTFAGSAPTQSLPIQSWRVERHQQLVNYEVGSSSVVDDASGTNWFWMQTTSPSTIVNPSLTLEGLRSDSACIEVAFAAPTNYPRDQVLLVNGDSATPLSESEKRSVWSTRAIKSSVGTLNLRGDAGFRILGTTLHALQLPQLTSGQAEFPAPFVGSLAIPFRVPSSSTDSLIGYAIVNGEIQRRVRLVKSSSVDTAGWTGWQLTDSAATAFTRYRIGTASSMLSSGSSYASLKTWSAPGASYALTDFSTASGDSMLVITPEAFLSEAQGYAQYRTTMSPRRKMQTRFLRVEDIYLLYSGGAADPTALRDFLRWSWTNLGTSHALLFGSSLFDMRDLKKNGTICNIPTWESQNYASDNYFAYLDSAEWAAAPTTRTVDINLGRIPARTSADLDAWFAKLKIFESPLATQDPTWRNTAMLVADDFYIYDKTPMEADRAGNHAEGSEDLFHKLQKVRPWLGFSKVFVAKYDFDANYNKPMARLDIISRINQGVLLFNYFGHGSPNKLAHETVFDLEAINALTNSSTPFLFYAGACAVGRFDGYDIPLGLTLLTTPGRAAVAAISATRATYAAENATLGNNFFETVFDTTPGARSLGEAMTKARLLMSDSDNVKSSGNDMVNHDAYALLGDPAMPLANVGMSLSLADLPDTLKALHALQQRGTTSTTTPSSIAFRIQSASTADTLVGPYYSPTPVELTPKSILSTTTTSNAGQFIIDAMTPAKLEFGKRSAFSAFAIDQTTGACGGYYQANILQYGTDTSSSTDTKGPTIAFAPCDSSYSGGEPFSGTAKVSLPFCLEVRLMDSTGISSATGPDEGTLINLPGVWDTYRPELKSGATYRQASFQLNIDSTKFTRGTTHQLSVLTHDQMGNFSRGALQIQIQNEAAVGLYDVFNRPNPIKSGTSTTFYFKVTADPDTNNAIPSTIQASIRIHTLSGKLIRILHTDLTQERALRPKATWNLKDEFGNDLANGLYPYTVLLRVPGTTVGSWTQYEKRGIAALSR